MKPCLKLLSAASIAALLLAVTAHAAVIDSETYDDAFYTPTGNNVGSYGHGWSNNTSANATMTIVSSPGNPGNSLQYHTTSRSTNTIENYRGLSSSFNLGATGNITISSDVYFSNATPSNSGSAQVISAGFYDNSDSVNVLYLNLDLASGTGDASLDLESKDTAGGTLSLIEPVSSNGGVLTADTWYTLSATLAPDGSAISMSITGNTLTGASPTITGLFTLAGQLVDSTDIAPTNIKVSGESINFDNLIISQDSSVPEPASLGLIGVGALALLRRRK